MAWITDGLEAAFEFASRLNPFGRPSSTAMSGLFTHQLALAAYMSSGMLRKVIRIPAADRTQKWRDWQAEKAQIELIEKEEKRLGLRGKTKHAEILRGIGGGALILITAGDHSQPLDMAGVGSAGLTAINVVSRWEIQGQDWDRNLASPTYRHPRIFQISSDGKQQAIHPSRVICFRGDPLPAGSAMSDEDAFWGDSRLCQVFREVQNGDNAQGWFAELVKKAKLLRIGIPDLLDMATRPGGQEELNKRIALIGQSENLLNATVYRSDKSADEQGEKISDFTMNWTGIPAMMDAFNQQIAAVSDIPFTRLMGRSPAGMNATGQHDTDNWYSTVSDGQENETRPCLELFDEALIRSAGVDPAKVTWRWAPLRTVTEQEEATTFNTTMDAVTKLQATGTIPDEAFAKGVQNLMAEREYIPGLDQALAEIPEAERFGIHTDPNEDDIEEGGDPASRGGGADNPAARASASQGEDA